MRRKIKETIFPLSQNWDIQTVHKEKTYLHTFYIDLIIFNVQLKLDFNILYL